MATRPNINTVFCATEQSDQMSLTVRELLVTFGKQLVLHTPSDAAELDRHINWVAPTELLDPTPFIVGNELILTTGVSLVQGTSDRFDRFVASLAGAKAAALGFGTGLSHDSVPPELLKAAHKYNIPLVEVPYETAFIELSRVIAESVIAERFELVQRGLATHESLASVLLGGGNLEAMVGRLHQLVGGPAAVIDVYGRRIASSSDSQDWPIDQPDGTELGSAEVQTAPIRIDGELVAHLFLRTTDDEFSAHSIPYASTLIALEMSRRQAELIGRRELVGQVVEDVLAQRIPHQDAHRRLAAFGVDLTEPTTVIVVSPSHRGVSLRRSWSGHDLRCVPLPFATATIDGDIVVIATAGVNLAATAKSIHERLLPLDNELSVGIGGSHTTTSGLRMSYFEAREAVASHGPGVHQGEAFNLTTMLMVNRELPLHDVAARLLEPLILHDRERGSELLRTLHVFLQVSGSISEAATELTLHRNSLRYRLAQIAELVGVDLGVFPERVRLWIALQALELDGTLDNIATD